MAKNAPWDEQTNNFITSIDATIAKKYSLSLRGLLLHADKYVGKKDITTAVQNIKKDINDYFTTMLSGLADEKAKLEGELEGATGQYRQIDAVIASKAAVARVPYLKPLYIDRNTANEETVIIGQYDDTLDAFIGKLVYASNYIADMSTVYKQYTFGSWLFSGQKNYVLVINPPVSAVLVINNSMDTINGMLDDVAEKVS